MYDKFPAWSPDGKKIAFLSTDNDKRIIFIMDIDGTEIRKLTDNKFLPTMPSWSPDGNKIAFQMRVDNNWEIFVINIDGSGLTRLTNNDVDDHNPNFRKF